MNEVKLKRVIKLGKFLRFRVALPARTDKMAKYQYFRILNLSAYKYLRDNFGSRFNKQQIIDLIDKARYAEGYDGYEYLELPIFITGKEKNQEDIIIDINI